MKIAIRIFLIFSLLFVLAGAGCMGAGFVLGGSFEEVSRIGGEIPLNFWKNGAFRRIAVFSAARHTSGKSKSIEGTEGINKEGVSFAGAENLCVAVAAGSVELLEGEGEEILVESSSDVTEAKLEDGTLTIRDNWKGWSGDEPVTKVKIPVGYVFKKVTLTGTGGEIVAEDLTADVVVIEANASNIDMDGRLQAREKLEVKANAADVTIEQAAWVPTAILNSNMGDIDVTFEGIRNDYDVSATSNMGDIMVEDGDGESGHNPTGQIQAKSNLGNIDIEFE
ncbi:MAG: DUF4097 domain-containing protein [Lachnospiraceae bacterium]|nr:DUF4097 domain-containing protein [Lachnospiraceae bacterium]